MVTWQTVNLHKVTRVQFTNYSSHTGTDGKFWYETITLRIEYGGGECAVEHTLFSNVEGALLPLQGVCSAEQLRLGV